MYLKALQSPLTSALMSFVMKFYNELSNMELHHFKIITSVASPSLYIFIVF